MGAETALNALRIAEHGKAMPGVVAIAGPQAFVREYVLDAIRARLVREGRQYRAFQVAGGDFEAVLSELRAPDLFAPKKAVACRILRSRRGQEGEGGDESETKGSRGGDTALAEAIERGGLCGELVLIYEKDSVPAKVRRAVERTGLLISCMRPFDNQIPQYANAFASALGLKLAPDAIDALVSRYAGDLSAMANALAKAALHLEKGARVQIGDLLEPGATRTPELFDLAESVARGQLSLTLALLDRAVAIGRDVFELLAVEIIPVVRRMLIAAAMIERGKSTYEIAGSLGLNPASGLATRAIEGARRFGIERLHRAHQRLCELDAGFKMGLLKERQSALSQALVELMVR